MGNNARIRAPSKKPGRRATNKTNDLRPNIPRQGVRYPRALQKDCLVEITQNIGFHR